MIEKKSVSIFVLSALTVCLCSIPVVQGDESRTGAYGDQSAAPPAPAPQQPGTASDSSAMAPVSTAEKGELTGSWLQNEAVAFQPQFGMINYRDTLGNVGNRATYGMTFDSNLAHFIPGTDSTLYLGPQIGFIYSHLGSGNADFFGSSPSNPVGDPGTNAFYVPTNLKLGYNLGNFRPSVHAGANLFYTSSQASFALGPHPSSSPGSGVTYLPDLGLDFEYAVAKQVTLLMRPEITFAGSNPIWAASVGASIPIG